MKKDKRFFIYSLLFMSLTVTLLILLQLDFEAKRAHQYQLGRALSQMQQHHTTMYGIVQLAVIGHQSGQKQDYQKVQDKYHASLEDVQTLMQPGWGRSSLRTAEQAHLVFHARDAQIFRLLEQGKWQQAKRQLQTKAYRLAKLRHGQSLEVLFLRFQKSLNEQGASIVMQMLVLQLVLVLISMAVVFFWRLIQASRLETHQITMRTVMDVVNNNLNRLRLQQLSWQKHKRLSPDELQTLRLLIQETSAALKQMGDIEAYKTCGQGATELLDWQAFAPELVPQLPYQTAVYATSGQRN